MIAANVAQSVIGWAGGIALILVFIAYRADDLPGATKRWIGRSVAVLIPCWMLYGIAAAIGAVL